MSRLLLHDTRTRSKRPFEPLEPGQVRMYSCGPTVYAPQHLGNLRSQLFADLLKRAFLAEGLRVTHVINVTDVGHLSDDADAGEDKLERAARQTGENIQSKLISDNKATKAGPRNRATRRVLWHYQQDRRSD